MSHIPQSQCPPGEEAAVQVAIDRKLPISVPDIHAMVSAAYQEPLTSLARCLHMRWAARFRDDVSWLSLSPEEQEDWRQIASALITHDIPAFLRDSYGTPA